MTTHNRIDYGQSDGQYRNIIYLEIMKVEGGCPANVTAVAQNSSAERETRPHAAITPNTRCASIERDAALDLFESELPDADGVLLEPELVPELDDDDDDTFGVAAGAVPLGMTEKEALLA